jgi:hypothetical protein
MEDAHGTPPDDGRGAVHQRTMVVDSAFAAAAIVRQGSERAHCGSLLTESNHYFFERMP